MIRPNRRKDSGSITVFGHDVVTEEAAVKRLILVLLVKPAGLFGQSR